MKNKKNKLTTEQQKELLIILQTRFEKNIARHKNIKWADVLAKLEAQPEKLWSLEEMEKTDGEPDVIDFDKKTGEFIFCDCAAESPKGRRSICYDHEALEKERKTNLPIVLYKWQLIWA